MSKIQRYNGNVQAFASQQLSNERTLFGQTTIADDLASQITPQFLRGWGIVGPSDQPSLQDFNAVCYTLAQFISYLHQMGVPEYDTFQEYYVGSVVQVSGSIYISLSNANIGNVPTTSPANWRTASYEQATESALGVLKLATQAMVTAGTDDLTAVTPLKLKTALDLKAPINSPTFTGTPSTNSTPQPGDNSGRLVNTNYLTLEFIRLLVAATESARGIVFLATAAEVAAGVESTKALTPLRLQGKIDATLLMTAGYNRTYSNVTGSRVGGTTYTNSNNFPILVVVSIVTQPGVDTVTVTVGSTIVYTGDLGVSGMTVPVSFLVGNGQTYKVDLTGGATISKWVEMI